MYATTLTLMLSVAAGGAGAMLLQSGRVEYLPISGAFFLVGSVVHFLAAVFLIDNGR